jgi:hypothetical protein
MTQFLRLATAGPAFGLRMILSPWRAAAPMPQGVRGAVHARERQHRQREAARRGASAVQLDRVEL